MGKTTTKRRDSKNRILRTGESQRADGRYEYKYTSYGKRKTIYSWRLTPADPYPVGKKQTLSLREMEQEINLDLNSTSMTIVQLLNYSLQYNKNLKRKSIEAYKGSIRCFEQHSSYANECITKATKALGRKIFTELGEKYHYAFKTLKLLKTVLSKAFDLAIELNWVTMNPFNFDLATVVQKDQKTLETLSREQQDVFLTFMKNDKNFNRYYNGLSFLLCTGLRISEMCAITVGDVDFSNKRITINKQLLKKDDGSLYVETPKSQKGYRVVPVNDEALDLIRDEIRSHPNKLISLTDYVFANRKTGKPLTSIYWSNGINRMRKRYDATHETPMAHITPHILRHTYCTNMAYAGTVPVVLQGIMGHANISITMDYYTHRNVDRIQEEYDRVMENTTFLRQRAD